jgi:hypothetical protein
MLLQDLHEASDIELRIQGEVVYVRNEVSDFLFETVEAFFECVIGFVRVVAVFIVAQIVIRTAVLGVGVVIRLLAFDVCS